LPIINPFSLPSLPCFVSTACVTRAGLPDDCHELQSLRALRSRYVSQFAEGLEFLEEYRKNSGIIIDGINQDAARDEIWDSLLGETRQVVQLVDAANDEDAFAECRRIYEGLRSRYC
jgi:hypothetical protein